MYASGVAQFSENFQISWNISDGSFHYGYDSPFYIITSQFSSQTVVSSRFVTLLGALICVSRADPKRYNRAYWQGRGESDKQENEYEMCTNSDIENVYKYPVR